MPLTGQDFSPAQRQALRAMADVVQPGLSDTQVLEWATRQGVQGAMRAAFERFAATVTQQTNQERRATLAPVAAVVEAGDPK